MSMWRAKTFDETNICPPGNTRWWIHKIGNLKKTDQNLVQRFRATVHQLHQREVAAVLQPPHVCVGTGRIPAWRHWVDLHRFRHGSATVYRIDWEGIPNMNKGFTTSHRVYLLKERLAIALIPACVELLGSRPTTTLRREFSPLRTRSFVIPKCA